MNSILLVLGLVASLGNGSLVDTSGIPDILSFPYSVYLVQCQYSQSGLSTATSSQSCTLFCAAQLSSAYVVSALGACVDQSTNPLNFVAPSSTLGEFELSSVTTDADLSLRYILTGAGSLYVTRCVSPPCTVSSTFIPMGRVFLGSSYGISSKSQTCSTCGAQAPIPIADTVGVTGAVSLFKGLSAIGSTQSVPGSTAYNRANGTLVNFVSFDRASVSLSQFPTQSGTVESLFQFSRSRPPSTFQTQMNSVCSQIVATSSSLTQTSFLSSQYVGKPQCADPVTGAPATANCLVDSYLPFTGPNNNQEMTFATSGTVAVCTCGVITTSSLTCANSVYWVFSGLLTVTGPTGGQSWAVPVGTVFGLTVTGFGLGVKQANQDFLRIIPSSASCTSNNNQPVSLTSIRTGCPACTGALTVSSDISATAVRSADDSSIPKITRIRVYESYTVFYFSSDISTLLVAGDRIAVSADDLLVDATSRSQWSGIQKHRAFKITGRSRYADEWSACYLNSVSDCDDYLNGHLVTPVSSTSVSIPVGLDEFESVSFGVVPGGADWERHSRISTLSNMVSTSVGFGNKVCWGTTQIGGGVKYLAQAGTIAFYSPPAMTSSNLTTVTRAASLAQPMLLTFTPSYTRNSLYTALASNSTVVIRITLLNTNLFTWLQAGDLTGSTLDSTGAAGTDSPATCGYLFTQLLVNDDTGFPQPSSCSFTSVVNNMGTSERVITLSIPPSSAGWNGLKSICQQGSLRQACVYQIGFVGMLGAALTSSSQVVRVDMSCPYCVSASDPYYVFESTTVTASFDAVTVAASAAAVSLTMLPSTFVASTYSYSAGTNAGDITPLTGTSINFAIARSVAGIPAASVLRLFFSWEWSIAATGCTASILESPAGSITCAIRTLSTVPTTKAGLVLTFTSAIPATSFTAGGDVSYTTTVSVAFTSSPFPPHGQFPNRVFAYLTSGTDQTSIYAVTTSTSFVSVVSSSTADAGSAYILNSGMSNDGPNPFATQTNNTVTVRAVLGRSLVGSSASLTITLPAGYWCSGSVGLPSLGSWSNVATPNVCKYTLATGMLLNVGSYLTFSLVLSNPSSPLLQTDIGNVWSLSTTSGSTTVNGRFVTSSTTGRANLAVIAPLRYAAIQPVGGSIEAPAAFVRVNVFLKITNALTAGSLIVVIAPDNVRFVTTGGSCVDVSLLADRYYYQSVGQNALFPFSQGDVACATSPFTAGQNSAVVSVDRIVDAGSIVAFSLGVTVSSTSVNAPEWLMFTTSASGSAMDGSITAVEYDGVIDAFGAPSSFSYYPNSAGAVLTAPTEEFIYPTMQTDVSVNFTISNIGVPFTVANATVKLTFPPTFLIQSLTNTSQPYLISSSESQVILPGISLDTTSRFNTTVTVVIPREPPSWASYTILVEVYDTTTMAPVSASVLSPPPIASIQNFEISTSTRAVSASNIVQLSFVSALGLPTGNVSPNAFVLSLSEVNDFTYVGSTLLVGATCDGSPIELTATVVSDESEPFSVRLASANASVALPSGLYVIQLKVTNPATTSIVAPTWTLRSTLEYPQTAPGYTILSPLTASPVIASGSLLLANPNTVSFQFDLPTGVTDGSTNTLVVHGPPGFYFNDDCSSDITGVASVVACRGSRISDTTIPSHISLQFTLDSSWTTSAQINVSLTNPVVRPSPPAADYWTFTLNSLYSSTPLASFQYSDLLASTVSITGVARSATSFPVQVTFTPRHSLPGSNTGSLPIRSDNGLQNYTQSSAVRITAPTGYVWDTSTRDWNEFRDLDANSVYSLTTELAITKTDNEILIGFTGNRSIVAGTRYSWVTDIFAPPSATPDSTTSSSEWVITSFKPLNLIPVDESSLLDPNPLYLPVTDFSVTNLDANYTPNAIVNTGVNVTLTTLVAIGDILTIQLPYGFAVDSFEPVAGFNTPLGQTTADGTHLISLTATAPGTQLVNRFQFSVTNAPSMSLQVNQTYFQFKHVLASGLAVYAGTALSWRVTPQVRSPQLYISGASVAAGSRTSLTLSFVPATEANYLLLNISAVPGFNFSLATSDIQLSRTLTNAACWACVLMSGFTAVPNVTQTIEINNVLLASGGGETEFVLSTFFVPPQLLPVITNPVKEQATYRDVATSPLTSTGGVRGFFLSGKLVVTSSYLTPIDRSAVPSYVTLPLNPRVGFQALASFRYNTTLSPAALPTATGKLNQTVYISFTATCLASAYQFSSNWSAYSVQPSIGRVATLPTVTYTGNQTVLNVVYTSMVSYFLTNSTLAFAVSGPVIPLVADTSSPFEIEVFANGTLINTNDQSTMFPTDPNSIPVGSISDSVAVSVVSTLVPPNCVVQVMIVVNGTFPSGTTALGIVAPPEFVFTSTACDASTSGVCGQANATNPNQIYLYTGTGDSISSIGNFALTLSVLTPSDPDAANSQWIAIAYNGANATLGWGALDSVPISVMPSVTLVYGGMSHVTGIQVVLDFSVRLNNSVNSLELVPPVGITLSCDTATVAFMECTKGSTLAGGLLMNISNSGTLDAGIYTISALASLPIQTPSENTFSLVTRDVHGNNVDGLYGFDGQPIVDSQTLSVSNPSVSLASTGANTQVALTLSFTTTMETTSVDAINLAFPPNYFHRITSPTQVISYNRRFPRISATGWLDTSSPTSVTFLVDNTETSIIDKTTGRPIQFNTIPGGQTYVFQLPVVLPPETPSIDNFWVLSFCPNRSVIADCVNVTGTEAIAQFPILGTTIT